MPVKPILGILGGGQLAAMLCDAARKQGVETLVYDPSPDACARLTAGGHYCKDYLNFEALREFGSRCTVITYEFENVPLEAAAFLEENFHNLPQGLEPLRISSNRILEKQAASLLGLPTAKFEALTSSGLLKALEKIGLPAILKTCSGGYDGKSQWLINSMVDALSLNLPEGSYILEEKIDFRSEASCIVVRTKGGQGLCLPPAENIHRKGILHQSLVPAGISEAVQKKIQKASQKLMEGLGFMGILGIEFFIRGEDIFFNEMAPRPHNSGHYSMDACDYSQFDLLVMALLGKNLPQPKLLSPALMLNILGEDKAYADSFISGEGQRLYIYGKTEWKIGRKMGHINFLAPTREELIQKTLNFKEMP